MQLNINKQFTIVKKETGKYHSFPTLIKQDEQLWLACRSAFAGDSQPHGVAGRVLLFRADAKAPDIWTLHGNLFSPSSTGTFNEIDAILSAPEPDLVFLATRDFQRQKRNDVYLSRGASAVLSYRTPLADISNQHAICFGHIHRSINGDLLMPAYCGFDDEPVGTPVLLVSPDRGQTWALRGKVASSTQVGARLTEYSLGRLGGTCWTALIRNETSPFELYRTESKDDGRTWSFPGKTNLRGHAPMILDLQTDSTVGRGHLVIYRDLAETEPGISIGISLDQGATWRRAGRLTSYRGSIYDGGYGDLVQLAPNRYLAVYYLCDGAGFPWVDGALFHF